MWHHMLACQDRKPTTEDGFGGAPGCGFYGVFDGHGGRRTVDYIEKHLHTNLIFRSFMAGLKLRSLSLNDGL